MILPNEIAILKYWIAERSSILHQRKMNKPKPWSKDSIFQHFKFCNVRREDDRVTKWLAENWRSEQYWDHPNFIPAMILARTINWPDTLAEIGFPSVWDPAKVLADLDKIQRKGVKVYTGAYMITAGPTGVRKNEWVIGNAKSYFDKPPKIYPTLEQTWNSIIETRYPCVGPFIAGQVIADLKQTKHLRGASDWWDWAALGPGSTRGLNRIHGRMLNNTIIQKQGLKEMLEVKKWINWEPELCLQDIQNCLCEFDKFRRIQLHQGKPRSTYPGL